MMRAVISVFSRGRKVFNRTGIVRDRLPASTWPASPGASNVTKWIYQEATGLLTNKTDPAGQSVSYTYWQGLEQTRTWARLNGTSAVTRTDYYNLLGELCGYAYSDGTPPVSITNQDRRGLPTEIDDASGTSELVYDAQGRMMVCG